MQSDPLVPDDPVWFLVEVLAIGFVWAGISLVLVADGILGSKSARVAKIGFALLGIGILLVLIYFLGPTGHAIWKTLVK
jgi:hypothetical protein